MSNHFRFPVVSPHIGSARVTTTYASVTRSILKRIAEWGIPKVQGKLVCPPVGHFEIILYEGVNSGLDHEEEDPRGSVRLWFSYPNVYLEAFKANAVWNRFGDMHPPIVPADAPAHRYQVNPLPFDGGYHNRGLQADWNALRFGRTTPFDIYKVLMAYPNNPGGLEEVRVVLTKSTALFSEGLRFPEVRRAFIYQLKSLEGVKIYRLSWYFTKWEDICKAIRAGPDKFVPAFGVNTFPELLALVGLLLHVG